MLLFWLFGEKLLIGPKLDKFSLIEEILSTTGFYKLPGLPQSSQLHTNQFLPCIIQIWRETYSTNACKMFCIWPDFSNKILSFSKPYPVVMFR